MFFLAEKLLSRMLFAAAALFLSLQLASGYRDQAAVDGRSPFGNGAGWAEGGQAVTFYLRDYSLLPYVRVVVNNEVRGNFKNRYVTVAVHDGDSLVIDGTFYNRPVSIEVLDVSGAVRFPRKGDVINLNGNLVSLGRVETEGPP